MAKLHPLFLLLYVALCCCCWLHQKLTLPLSYDRYVDVQMRPDQLYRLLNSLHLERSVVCRFRGYPQGVSMLPFAVSDIEQVLHTVHLLFLGVCFVSFESSPGCLLVNGQRNGDTCQHSECIL